MYISEGGGGGGVLHGFLTAGVTFHVLICISVDVQTIDSSSSDSSARKPFLLQAPVSCLTRRKRRKQAPDALVILHSAGEHIKRTRIRLLCCRSETIYCVMFLISLISPSQHQQRPSGICLDEHVVQGRHTHTHTRLNSV